MANGRFLSFIAGVLVFMALTKPAYAYLDPGTGSYIFQLLVAGLLGSTFFLRSFVRKLKQSMDKRDDKDKQDGDR